MGRKRYDPRPICDCDAYPFPHKIGGKCKGTVFAEFQFYNVKEYCEFCNCNNDTSCDVATGRESINEAECYIAAKHYAPAEHLIISFHQLENC